MRTHGQALFTEHPLERNVIDCCKVPFLCLCHNSQDDDIPCSSTRLTPNPSPKPTTTPYLQVEFIRPVSNTPETPPHAFDIQSVMREWTVCANDQVP